MNDKFMVCLWFVCIDYHSGQWSRGYELQCRLMKRITRIARLRKVPFFVFTEATFFKGNGYNNDPLYQELAKRFGDEL